MSFVKLTTSALAITAVAAATAAAARDQVQVAGSSTVLPYASIVAEAFGENFDFPNTGCGIGRIVFGASNVSVKVLAKTPSISPTLRAPFREKEIKACAEARRDRHHRSAHRI